MNEITNYRKILKGKSLEDYQQWEKRKKKDIDETEGYVLKKMKKNYEYKIGCIESFMPLEGFRTNYLYIIGIVLTLMVSVMVSFAGNAVGSIRDAENIANETEILEIIKLHQEINIEIMNEISKILICSGGVLLLILFVMFVYDYYKKKSLVAEKMFYEDMIRIINDKTDIQE